MIHYGFSVGFQRGLNEFIENELIEKGKGRKVAWYLSRRSKSPTEDFFFPKKNGNMGPMGISVG